MLTFLPGPVRGFLGITAFIFNTLFWAVPVYIVSIFKFAIPFKKARIFFDTLLNHLAYTWMYCNNVFIEVLKKTEFRIQGLEQLDKQVNDELFKECIARSGDISLDDAGAAAFILNEFWKRLRATHKLRVVE